jgi:hypothetical protein
VDLAAAWEKLKTYPEIAAIDKEYGPISVNATRGNTEQIGSTVNINPDMLSKQYRTAAPPDYDSSQFERMPEWRRFNID